METNKAKTARDIMRADLAEGDPWPWTGKALVGGIEREEAYENYSRALSTLENDAENLALSIARSIARDIVARMLPGEPHRIDARDPDEIQEEIHAATDCQWIIYTHRARMLATGLEREYGDDARANTPQEMHADPTTMAAEMLVLAVHEAMRAEMKAHPEVYEGEQ